jgi:hypothetical protein
MTTPLTLTRPAKIHCLARLFGVAGCFRSNQSNSGLVLTAFMPSKPKVDLSHHSPPAAVRSRIRLEILSDRVEAVLSERALT